MKIMVFCTLAIHCFQSSAFTRNISHNLRSVHQVSTFRLSSEEDHKVSSENHAPIGSLEEVLERARKRQFVGPTYRLQAFWEAPLIQIFGGRFTRGDGVLVLTSLSLQAYGFALGLVVGKLTIRIICDVWRPPVAVSTLLLPVWPVLWAIALDQIIS